MKKINLFAMTLAIVILGMGVSAQAISLTIGTGNFYASVGDYDYLPYAYNAYPGYQPTAFSFRATMSDYGTWVTMQPFGAVWRPYVTQGWRPYTEGHWSYTQYGPTWVGYEPWAWAAYHYGYWVYSQQFGWVWIPSYDYTPGRVAWAYGYNSLGWMPAPPAGYDYSRGYLAYIGPANQFTYGNSDFSFGIGIGDNNYYYGGPYYDPRYRDMYYNSNYLNSVAGQLWIFIDANRFPTDNYADYYYGGDYTQYLFHQHIVRVSTRPLDRVTVERIVGEPVQVRQVHVNEIRVDGKPVRLVAVQGEQQDVQKNANRVVRQVLAPAFAEKGKSFSGIKGKNQKALDRVLNQGHETPKVQTFKSDEIVREAQQQHQQREAHRAELRQQRLQQVESFQKEGKIHERKNAPGQLKKEENTGTGNLQMKPQERPSTNPPEQNRPDVTNQRNNQEKNAKAEKAQQNNPNKEQHPNRENNKNKEDSGPGNRRSNENMTQPGNPQIQQEKQQNHQPPEHRMNPDHSNVQPGDNQSNDHRNENAMKNAPQSENQQTQAEAGKQNNPNAKANENQPGNKSKKTKNNKSKKDKKDHGDDQTPNL